MIYHRDSTSNDSALNTTLCIRKDVTIYAGYAGNFQ